MLNILIRKFKRNLDDYGFSIALKKMITYPFEKICKRKDYLIYKKDLRKYAPNEKTNNLFEYKFYEGNNINEQIVKQILALEEWLIDKLNFILKHGGLCVVALDKDKVAGFNLVSFNEVYMPLLELNKKFRNNQAWSEQITVSKDYRKQGLGSILRYKMFNELKNRGYRVLYGGTMWDNWSNIELSKKVGFEIFVKVSFKRLFNKKKYTYHRIYSNRL
jgi:GNAT superfamily N-acetyltransferase